MTAEIREAARALLAAALEIEASAVPDDADIESLEAWTSVAHLRLVLAMEERLGAELKPDDAVAIVSLADVTALLARHGSQRS